MCSYRDRAEDFAALNATVVGISSQDLASHEEFMAKHGLNVPLLADVDMQVAKAYSAVGRMGTKRAVIVIDEDGIVRHRHDHLLRRVWMS
jgi:peroxiredoxin Q/BCP